MNKPRVVGLGTLPMPPREGAHVSAAEGFSVGDLRKLLRKLPKHAIVYHEHGEDYGNPVRSVHIREGKVILD